MGSVRPDRGLVVERFHSLLSTKSRMLRGFWNISPGIQGIPWDGRIWYD
jgi:hypothetical protein